MHVTVTNYRHARAAPTCQLSHADASVWEQQPLFHCSDDVCTRTIINSTIIKLGIHSNTLTSSRECPPLCKACSIREPTFSHGGKYRPWRSLWVLLKPTLNNIRRSLWMRHTALAKRSHLQQRSTIGFDLAEARFSDVAQPKHNV